MTNGIQLHGVYTQKWDPPVIDDADWKAASFEDMEAVKPDSPLDWRFLWNEDRMWDPDCMALFHAAFGRDILRTVRRMTTRPRYLQRKSFYFSIIWCIRWKRGTGC